MSRPHCGRGGALSLERVPEPVYNVVIMGGPDDDFGGGSSAATYGVMRGCVVAGRGLGRRLGFPTINVAVTGGVPPSGVYAGAVWIDGVRFPAAVHVGERPTLGDATPVVEAHLVGYQGEAGGREVTVRVGRRLRAVRRFASLEALRQQIEIDVQQSRDVAQETPEGRSRGAGE